MRFDGIMFLCVFLFFYHDTNVCKPFVKFNWFLLLFQTGYHKEQEIFQSWVFIIVRESLLSVLN